VNADSTHIILGPPGTGKTTYLLGEIDKLLRSFTPEKICFISFTKKASYEALERTMVKFDLDEEELPLFRTMHSLAFQFLRLGRNNIMTTKDYFGVCKEAGVGINFDVFDDFGVPQGFQRGNQLLNIVSQAKCRKVEPEVVWGDTDCEVSLEEVLDFNEIINTYKYINSKRDFNDMIIDFTNGGNAPDIQALIIDEAQDLSAIQWDMADYLSRRSIVNYVAGDDDQSIFEWAGADVDRFINISGKVKVLDQSWRVPKSIGHISTKIVSRIENRREKVWKPLEEEGDVTYINLIGDIYEDLKTGTWLLLARNNSMLTDYEDLCRDVGVFYKYAHKNKDFKDIISAVKDWMKLQDNGTIAARRAKIIYSMMSPVERVRHGSKSKLEAIEDREFISIKDLKEKFGLLCSSLHWEEALDRINEEDKIYVRKAIVIDNIDQPRVTISTIHGVKGGEADNVVIKLDMGYRAFAGLDTNPDAEHRVWYVGVTRAKKRLILVEPETSYSYDI